MGLIKRQNQCELQSMAEPNAEGYRLQTSKIVEVRVW
jgi:hypothetical protein